MPIAQSDVVVGGIYATANNQERRVTRIDNGSVYYEARGGNAQNEWNFGSSLSNPPSLESFANACDRIISKP